MNTTVTFSPAAPSVSFVGASAPEKPLTAVGSLLRSQFHVPHSKIICKHLLVSPSFPKRRRGYGTHRCWIPSWDSKAQRLRQKPSFGITTERRCTQCALALEAGHVNLRIKYAMHSAAERLTPAPQWTRTPGRKQLALLGRASTTAWQSNRPQNVKLAFLWVWLIKAGFSGIADLPWQPLPPQ